MLELDKYKKDQLMVHKSMNLNHPYQICTDSNLHYIGIQNFPMKNNEIMIMTAYQCHTCGFFPIRILHVKNAEIIKEEIWGSDCILDNDCMVKKEE